jgi:hypothetical protein
MARQKWLPLMIGGIFVGILQLLGHHDIATPVPFWLLLPGLLAGASTPGSGFDLKDDHPWSVLSTLIVYAVNFVLYSGLVHLLLRLSRSIVVSRKRLTV